VYLAGSVGELSQTKALKLLSILEEMSVAKYGYPFFGVDFKVWMHGPVIEDVFNDLEKETPDLFGEYIKRAHYDSDLFLPNKKFDDGEFSDNDISLMEEVIIFARHKLARNLVHYTHRPESPWAQTAKKNGILADLQEKKIQVTDILVDFTTVIKDNDYLLERYSDAVENLEFKKALKK